MKHEKLTFLGRKHTPETLLKMRNARLGTKQSKKTRAKISKIKRDAKRWTGEDNPNWKGGIHQENWIGRSSADNIRWRRRVLKNNGRKCAGCGKDLNGVCGCCGQTVRTYVHHIKSYQEFPKLRYKISNGMVLCESCHKNIENFANSVKPQLVVEVGNAEPSIEWIGHPIDSRACVETIYETSHN
jgi:5-methylcytosine-specific restriction endonuclease McrA